MTLMIILKKSPFYQSDLDLDPMTLILKLDLDMVKMSYFIKNAVSILRHSKVLAQRDTHAHTHRQYEKITFPHTWAVIKVAHRQIEDL